MEDLQFIHLQIYTHYSIFESICKIKDLIHAVNPIEMPGIAITDKDTLSAIPEFYKQATKKGIKPIIGLEIKFYLTSEIKSHILLLAKNKSGYKNLVKLSSLSVRNISFEILSSYSEGLIAICGNNMPEIRQFLLEQGTEIVENLLLSCKTVYNDDFYIGIQRKESFKNDETENTLLKIARGNNIPVVAVNPVRYLYHGDREAFTAFYQDSIKKVSGENYLKSVDEMITLFSDLPEAITNTVEIYNKISTFSIDDKPFCPQIKLQEKFNDLQDYLKYLVNEGAKKRYREITKVIRERIDYELSVISKNQNADCFLFYHDLIGFMKKSYVIYTAKGQLSGSIVNYCLGISDIDPIKYDLLFERFISTDESFSIPSIDLDIDERGRDETMAYLKQTYGHKNIARLVVFENVKPRVLLDRAIAYYNLTDKQKRAIEEKFIKYGKYGMMYLLSKLHSLDFPEARKVSDFIEKLHGVVANTRLHETAYVVASEELTGYFPVQDNTIQYEFRDLPDNTPVFNFSSFKFLSIIRETVNYILTAHEIKIDIRKIPLDDERTYMLFQNGDTEDILNFTSKLMQKYLKKLKPKNIEELSALNSLFRPGPMAIISEFIKAKKEKRSVWITGLEQERKIVKSTYGMVIYQEQMILLLQKFANFSPEESNEIQKALYKRKLSSYQEMMPLFLNGCIKNGISVKTAEKLWEKFYDIANYLFNKSHSMSSVLISYKMAYLKTHYPVEYYAARLKVKISNELDVINILKEIKSKNIKVEETKKNIVVDIEKGKILIGKGGIELLKQSIQYTFFNKYTQFEYMANEYIALLSLLDKMQLEILASSIRKEVEELWLLRQGETIMEIEEYLNWEDSTEIIHAIKNNLMKRNKIIEYDSIFNIVREMKIGAVKQQDFEKASQLRSVERHFIKQYKVAEKQVWEITCKNCNHTFTTGSLNKIMCPSCGHNEEFNIQKK